MAEVYNNVTKCQSYEPTASELKLLEVLCNPDFATLNKTEKCDIAGVCTRTYDRAMEKEGFRGLIEKTAYDLVFQELLPVIKATAKFAKSNPNCASDRKLIVQMAGMVTEKTEHSGKIEMPQIIITK